MPDPFKRIRKTAFVKRVRLALKRLSGLELRQFSDMVVNCELFGDWWLNPELLDGSSVIYSLGVGKNIRFDCELIRRFGAQVHAFDPTPSTVEWFNVNPRVPAQLALHPQAVSDKDGNLMLYPRITRKKQASEVMYTLHPEPGAILGGVEVPTRRIGTIMRTLGHDHIDLLKMDIEGAEYTVLHDMLDCGIFPTQILVELHHRFKGIGIEKSRIIVGRLMHMGYGITAVSDTGRELTLQRRKQ